VSLSGARRGLRVRLTSRQTREMPSHIPSPSTTATRWIGAGPSPPVPVPFLFTTTYALSSISTPSPLMRIPTNVPPQGLSPSFSLSHTLDGTARPVVPVCSRLVVSSLLLVLPQPARSCFPTSAIVSIFICCTAQMFSSILMAHWRAPLGVL
jgi:hypothetical protein